MILFFRRKMKDDFSQELQGNTIFSLYSVRIVSLFPTHVMSIFCQKSKDDLSRKKMKKDDTYLRKYGISSHRKTKDDNKVYFDQKVPMIHCIFMGISCMHFHCFPIKKPGSLIYRTDIWLLLLVICLETFYNDEYSILYTIHPSGVVFRDVRECQLKKFGFLFKLYVWGHSTKKNIQYSIPFIYQELYLGVCLSANQGNIYNSKNTRAVTESFSVYLDWTFLMLCAKKLLKIAIIEEVVSRRRPPFLRNFSFKFYH